MAQGSVHYCWHCYAANCKRDGSVCQVRPSDREARRLSYGERLIWALGHPLPGTQMIAAQILGERRELGAEQPLRALVSGADPFLAAQALDSLVSIVGRCGGRGPARAVGAVRSSGGPACRASRLARCGEMRGWARAGVTALGLTAATSVVAMASRAPLSRSMPVDASAAGAPVAALFAVLFGAGIVASGRTRGGVLALAVGQGRGP